jgi:AcrR family transcriptional regulator
MLLTAMSPKADGDRQRNAERTRTEILDVATTEFARLGYAGARVDEIAALTTTTKRMIYYYFGSKEQLYIAVLERAFEAFRPQLLAPEGTSSDPLALVRGFAEHTFDQHMQHPELTRLLTIENIHEGRHIANSEQYRSIGQPAFELLDQALAEGVRQGIIRPGVDARDVFMIVYSFCTFRISNRFTFQQFSGRDLLEPSTHEHQRRMLTDLVLSYLAAPRDRP